MAEQGIAQAKTDRFFWRIVPVGWLTVLVSGGFLGMLMPGGPDGIAGVLVRGQVAAGMAIVSLLFFGVIVWLPLMVVWNATVLHFARRYGLLKSAVFTSLIMVLLISVVPVAVIVQPVSAHGTLLALLWVATTAGTAAGLTWLAFRRASLEELE